MKSGPGAVAQCLSPRIAHLGSLPAPCLWPGKAVEDGPKLWEPAPTWETGRGSWLRIGIASAVVLTWGVNHRMEDLPLCLSSLYIRLSNKNKINL